MNTSIHIRVPEIHRHELLAGAAKSRLVDEATRIDPARTDSRRPALARSVVRQALSVIIGCCAGLVGR